MEELFPVMLQALNTASERIQSYLANCFNDIPSPLTEEQKDEFVDSMSYLRNRLMQLNSTVNTEYKFDQGLTGDIDDYSKLLNEHHSELGELVSYLLLRPTAFPNDPYAKYDTIFLKEVLEGIIHQGNTLNKLLEFAK
jgi:hypothetical protein